MHLEIRAATAFKRLRYLENYYKLLEKITNIQLNEFISQFEKFLNGILAKELFSCGDLKYIVRIKEKRKIF